MRTAQREQTSLEQVTHQKSRTWSGWSEHRGREEEEEEEEDDDDEEDDEIEFLIIEQPEVAAPGTPGFARVSIGFHKKEASGGTIHVKAEDGYEATWEGRPGVRAAFGRRDEGKMTVVLEGPNGTEELDLDIKPLKKTEQQLKDEQAQAQQQALMNEVAAPIAGGMAPQIAENLSK